jgi:hypothetical protein
MTSAEFTEAIAFDELEPDPAEVSMHLMAQLLAFMHNNPLRQGEAPYVPDDFLPGGNRQERLARGTALLAQYAAEHARRKN